MNRKRAQIVSLGLVFLIAAGCAAKAAKQSKVPKGGVKKVFTLTASTFGNGQQISVRNASKGVTGGENLSIPLSWENAPEGTKSFAVVMVDRHPVAGNWVHWMVINIPAAVSSLPEGASGTSGMPTGSKELDNTFGEPGYGGPQPPPGTGDHDYETTIYALDVETISLSSGTTLDQFTEAIKGKVVGSTKLTGSFSR